MASEQALSGDGGENPSDDDAPIGAYFRTTDPDEASAAVARSFAPNELEPRGPGGSIDLQLWVEEFDRLNIGYCAWGADIRISAPPTESGYIVCLPTVGRTQASCGRDRAFLTPEYGAVMRPTEPFGFDDWSEDCLVLGVRINKADVEDELAAMLGRPLDGPLRFEFGMDLATGQGGSFLRALKILRAETQLSDGMARNPVMASRLSQLVISGLLVAQPHNYSDDLMQRGKPAAPETIRRAIEFIETRPADITSASDVARSACLSLRATDEGFKKHVGMSPMTYLREVRLARVRDELLRSEPYSTTVAAVATGWGFTHLGRFTEAYRRKYGVLPSQTLRERRPHIG